MRKENQIDGLSHSLDQGDKRLYREKTASFALHKSQRFFTFLDLQKMRISILCTDCDTKLILHHCQNNSLVTPVRDLPGSDRMHQV